MERKERDTYGDHFPWRFGRAIALLDELFRCSLKAVLDSEHIDPEHILKVLLCQLEQRLDLSDASVGNPNTILAFIPSVVGKAAIHTLCSMAQGQLRPSGPYARPR